MQGIIFANVSCLKMKIQIHLLAGFFAIFFFKCALLKLFYFNMKLLQSSTILKQKNNQEVSCV